MPHAPTSQHQPRRSLPSLPAFPVIPAAYRAVAVVAVKPAGFAPTNLAVISGGSTDFFLSDSTRIVRLRSDGSVASIDFTNAAQNPLKPVDIAASDDSRFLFVLADKGAGGGELRIYYTADGSVSPVVSAVAISLIAPGAGVAGSRLSANQLSSSIQVSVLSLSGASKQVQTFNLQ